MAVLPRQPCLDLQRCRLAWSTFLVFAIKVEGGLEAIVLAHLVHETALPCRCGAEVLRRSVDGVRGGACHVKVRGIAGKLACSPNSVDCAESCDGVVGARTGRGVESVSGGVRESA